MAGRRVPRLNSLFQEVIAEVLTKDLHHIQKLPQFVSITNVEITADLNYAKIYVSVIGDSTVKKNAIVLLNNKAGPIAYAASKKIRIRTFPKIHFLLDEGLEKQLRIQEILDKVSPKNTLENVVQDNEA